MLVRGKSHADGSSHFLLSSRFQPGKILHVLLVRLPSTEVFSGEWCRCHGVKVFPCKIKCFHFYRPGRTSRCPSSDVFSRVSLFRFPSETDVATSVNRQACRQTPPRSRGAASRRSSAETFTFFLCESPVGPHAGEWRSLSVP